jgi:hypothetical protein
MMERESKGQMDEKIKPRGRGRPVKKVPRGKKRVQISMIVSAELKTRIDAKAKSEGRTFSQIGEMMLERADVVDGMIKTLNRPLEDIVQEAFEVEMLRRGYKKLRMPDAPRGFAWVPPDLLGKKPNEFVGPSDEERKTADAADKADDDSAPEALESQEEWDRRELAHARTLTADKADDAA